LTEATAAIIKEVIGKVDKFIYDLENGNIELNEKAKTLDIFDIGKGRFGQTTKRWKGSYLNSLGYAISDYKSSTLPRFRWEYAQECLKLIEWGHTHGVFVNKGLEKKLKSLEEENNRLKELTVTAIAKTDDAHQLLYSLENELRQFVFNQIQQANGIIEKSILRDWESSKKKEALPPRKPKNYDLIYYSTFDQLKRIIVQNENWEGIFKKYFGRPSGVISRINELDEIRDTIAHNRTLSDFDYDCFRNLSSEISSCIEMKNNVKKSAE